MRNSTRIWKAATTRPERLRLIISAYETKVEVLYRHAVSHGTDDHTGFYYKRHAGQFERAYFVSVTSMCERDGLNGIDFVNAQFMFWPRDSKHALIPPVKYFFNNRARANYLRYLDARPVNVGRTAQEKKDIAIQESEGIIRSLMKTNKKLYPTVRAVLRNPFVVTLLSKAYLRQSPEFQALVSEGYYSDRYAA